MSLQDKKETNMNYNFDQTIQNNIQIFNRSIEEMTRSLNQVFNESKKSVERNISEANNQIPRYTQSINEVQEQAVQATKDIAENYLECQKQVIDSFQSIISPYIENANNQLHNNQELFRRLPEIYSKIGNNYTENSIAMSRIINSMAFSNVELMKNAINNTKEQSKHLAEIGKRNVIVYETIEKENRKTI